jgi:hypothetical protein
VLARWAGLAVEELVPEAEPVIDECGNLPLALAMIGAQLKGKPAGHWEIVLRHLRRADLAKVTARFPEPHTTLLRAIQVSFEALRDEDPIAARRYLELAVLLEDMVVVPVVQQALWNVDEWEALETADRFVGFRWRSGMQTAVESGSTTCNWISCARSIRIRRRWNWSALLSGCLST